MDVKMREITKHYQKLKNDRKFKPSLLDKLNSLKLIKK